VRRQIKKHARVFVAILFLLVGAVGITGYILSNQRFYLPPWVPVVGTDFYTVKAELPTGQAIVPGQGQTVNVAGVKVGEVGSVELEDGIAVIDMDIQEKYRPIYRDASVLLRPKTGLKDMYLALDPGTRGAGDLPEGGRVRVANTLPDVNSDEILAELDGDTRAYLQILLNAGGTAFDDRVTGADRRYSQTAAQDLRETFKRFEPTARYGARITRQLAERRQNLRRVIHNFQELSTALAHRDRQLASLVDSANANFQAFASEESSLREAVRLFPGALEQTRQTLTKTSSLAAELGPALERLRPFARELAPALRKTQPFFRETTPIIRDQIRPFARDVQPTVRDLRSATNDLAVVTPRLSRTFGVLNRFFNILAYDPPGSRRPFNFWAAWAAHAGATMFDLQDAQGPIRRSIVLVNCNNYNVLEQVILGNPQLGLLATLLNLPPEQQACPQNQPPDDFVP
jgi:phospholipid/cholesterol/gamma-HCH transport system substrate-binding protein